MRRDGLDLAESLVKDNATIAEMRADGFDLVIRDVASWQTQLPAKMLNVPEIDFMAVGTLQPIAAPRWSAPNPIAYIPQMSSAMLPSPVSQSTVHICI